MKKVHFIGICGVGMSATAKLLKDLGWEITGSDSGFYPPVSTLLKTYDISYAIGYKKENIPKDVELIVIGKNAKLTPEENEEVREAFSCGASVRSFPEIIRGLTEKTENIVVAGSWGKSTCTALLSWCLVHAKKKPSYFVGASIHKMKNTAKIDEGGMFVLEGDEYPSANWDPTSKFLYYNPHDVLLTSAEHDHVNVFPTHKEYLLPFQELLALVPDNGKIVVCADEPHAMQLVSNIPSQHAPKVTKTRPSGPERALCGRAGVGMLTYGLNSKADWTAQNIRYGEITTFDLIKNGKKIISLRTTLLGKHNVQNIIGVSAMLLEKKLLSPHELADGVATFRGITRRLDLKTNKSSVLVYEGFGTSYEKARAAFSAMKQHFPNRRLITFFEPHTFSWRNKDTIHWYDDVFQGCDGVFIYEPATQGAQSHAQLSQDDIVKRVMKAGYDVTAFSNEKEGLELLKKELRIDDVVLLMTSGDLGGLIESIPKFVEKKFPK